MTFQENSPTRGQKLASLAIGELRNSAPIARPEDQFPAMRKQRLRHLVVCLTAALGWNSYTAPSIAASFAVNICSDADVFQPPHLLLFGLRSAVDFANDGDTIDLTELPACTITLTAGEIPITVNNLTFKAAPGHNVTIDAHKASRIFNHTGTGGVGLSYVSLANGYSDPPRVNQGVGSGGCLYSGGSLTIEHATISGCEAAYGSAIYLKGNMLLSDSVVSGNVSASHSGYAPQSPGAIYAFGTVVAKYSQISKNSGYGIVGSGNAVLDNTVISGNTNGGGVSLKGYITLNSSTIDGNSGPGISTGGAITLNSSTISNNHGSNGGGIAALTLPTTHLPTLILTDSTISGNSAFKGGGIFGYYFNLKISNSTISGNSASSGGGVYAKDCVNFVLQSSIIAGDSVGSNNQLYSDVHLSGCAVTGGGNNLVGVLSFPMQGTLTGPAGLAPLAYHGGPVKTHALLATSHAINAGNNTLNLATDGRGSGFPRVVGTTADIGAYERQANDDEIFYNGLE